MFHDDTPFVVVCKRIRKEQTSSLPVSTKYSTFLKYTYRMVQLSADDRFLSRDNVILEGSDCHRHEKKAQCSAHPSPLSGRGAVRETLIFSTGACHHDR
jgi:hypothetical protein